jgi:S-formylglutathione hydrolase
MLMLHGGNGSEQDLLRFTTLIDEEINEGRIPPLVIAMPSARRSLYMDYRDGSQRWETFIVSELLPHLRKSLNVATKHEQTYIGGWSMGGHGSLRLAFKHPDTFAAVAALEPAIEPALFWHEVGENVRFWRSEKVLEEMFGSPIDTKYWEDNNPATIAMRDPERLLDLAIYIEVGDQDMLYLHKGTEFLHRILFDAGLAHEYRLVHGAEHVGPSLAPRLLDALGFIGRQIAPPDWINDTVHKVREIMDNQKRAIGMKIEDVDPRRLRGR